MQFTSLRPIRGESQARACAGHFDEPAVVFKLSFPACLAGNPGSFPALLHSSVKSGLCGFIDSINATFFV